MDSEECHHLNNLGNIQETLGNVTKDYGEYSSRLRGKFVKIPGNSINLPCQS